MRRSVLSVILAASLSLVACSEQPTELPSRPEVAPSTAAPLNAASCTLADVLRLTSSLFPPGPARTAILALANRLPPNLPQRQTLAARRAMLQIVDLLLKAFYAGRLYQGTSAATYDKVLDLIEALHCYVGLTPPTFPTTTAGSDIVVRVLSPNVAFDFSTPGAHAGLRGGAGAVTTAMGAVIVTISDLPDQPPPLRTSLNQYPRFYHFSGQTATGAPVQFNEDVIAATCLRAGVFDGQPDNLRLAHNVGPNFGDVEVLPRSAVIPTAVTCPDEIGSTGGRAEGSFAWARKLFLPAELHATSTALVELPVGGTMKKFSEFGIVDQTSNPAGLSIVDQNGNPISGSVSGPGTVYVKAASQNGDPIKEVPVTFGGAAVPVLTGPNGIASFVWTATPGTSLTATVPNEAREVAPSCPSDIPPHAPADPYRPLVCFTPSSVTFTATVAADNAGGGDMIVIDDMNMFQDDYVSKNFYNGVDPVDNLKFFENVASYSNSGPRGTQHGVMFHRGHNSQCGVDGECATAALSQLYLALSEAGFTVSEENVSTAGIGIVASNVKVLFLMTPRTNYSPAEVLTLKAFLAEGGRLFFVGENPAYYLSDGGLDAQNDLLQQMGSGLRASTTLYAACDHPRETSTIPSDRISSLPVTSGVSTLSIPCAARLVLGAGDLLIAEDIDGFPAAAFAHVSLGTGPVISAQDGAARQNLLPQSHQPRSASSTSEFGQTDPDGTGRVLEP